MNIQCITVSTYRLILSDNQTLFLYFIANFIHRFAVAPDCCWQLTRASISLHRQGKVKVTHGQCLQSDRAWHVTATTNHTLSYKL